MSDENTTPLENLHDQDFHVEITATERKFQGHVWEVVADDFMYLTPEGNQEIRREYVKHTGAVAVVALNDRDEVLLLQQYRHPVRQKLWEIPAGLLDQPGEDMLSAAQRELAEETDLTAATWATLTDIYTTPGGSSEAMRIFVAKDLTEIPEEQRYSRDDEESDMSYQWVSISQAVQLVLSGALHNGPTVVGVLAVATSKFEDLRDAKAPWQPNGLEGRTP